MKKNLIHLVCNAHIDPVWQWDWEEGAAEAISTFRIAAEFCKKFDGFIFNHNEAILYKWIEEYEPDLFKTIQQLVKEGKWHIMGGWFLQPDCNMPNGESIIRQILLGKNYFWDKFGVCPSTAINFDTFGHSRGLVQILSKTGYDSYIFGRPNNTNLPLTEENFLWIGYDGSEIMATRSMDLYNSPAGKATEKIEKWIKINKNKDLGIVLWGIGNHGGGPSKIDLENINKLIKQTGEIEINHSTPERYFASLSKKKNSLLKFSKSLRPEFVGCYTSMSRVKQAHRKLENDIYMLEKMASTAFFQDLSQYPKEKINEAIQNLLISEFHDALPGTSIQPVEESTLRTLMHGSEIVVREKAKIFFTLCKGQSKPKDGHIPILIFNPHPYKINTIIESEFSLSDINRKPGYTQVRVLKKGKEIPSQTEKPLANIKLDWRKKIVFQAELEAGTLNRFDCKLEIISEKPKPKLKIGKNNIVFKSDDLYVVINRHTGLIDKYRVEDKNILSKNSFQAIVLKDNSDPWNMKDMKLGDVKGCFKLMNTVKGAKFSGVEETIIESVRIIEDGDVRSIIEAVFSYDNSQICQYYKIPKRGTELEIEIRVYWNQKDNALKLSVPLSGKINKIFAQDIFGIETNECQNTFENVCQKWVACSLKKSDTMITCINNGSYGYDFTENTLRPTLLRSPAYCGHPVQKEKYITHQDRFTPRIDQGEHVFNFWINAGNHDERLSHITREAMTKNEKPFALSFFSSDKGIKPKPLLKLSDDSIVVSAMKCSEKDENLIIRLHEPTGKKRSTMLSLPTINRKIKVSFKPFETITIKIDIVSKKIHYVNFMEHINN